jgi:TolB-like protein
MLSTNYINRTLVLLVVCAAVSAGFSTRTPQAFGMVGPPEVSPRIAVLPLENLSGKPAPLDEIRQALVQKIVGRGASVLLQEDLEQFMGRHRVRYTGGIDTGTARALRDETGVGAVLITSVEQYSVSDPPAITITQRLVSTEDIPRILWMENVAMTGEDSPGILGLGLIHDMKLLQEKDLERLSSSLADFFSGTTTSRNRGGAWRFAPQIFFQSPFLIPGRRYTVAVAPFLNKSDRPQADEIMALHFTQQLANAGIFDVVDPGVVREQLLRYRVIMKDGASVSDADLIQNSVQADLIVTGKVLKYQDSVAAATTPKVEFEVLVFEKKRKKIVWASWSFHQGDKDVFFFDWGRIRTAGMLASKMATAVVRDITSLGAIKDPRLIEEQSRRGGSWALLEHAFPGHE